jgi:2-dehydro-3-deoxyglucarate aldolase/4-hydroxy-2-oxoheptanedioate aldolase
MKVNKFQQSIAATGTAAGHMISDFGTRNIARIVAGANPDFVMIDMEHTGYDTERIADLCAWFRATDIAPFVRIPQGLYHFCARTLDRRGVALGGAHNDFVMPDPVEYFHYANQNTTVIAMIESPIGLANIDAIAATPGVDVLWVGHYDLTQAMGIPAQFQHPDFIGALRAVTAAARRHGKQAGIQPGRVEDAQQWRDLGFNVISWGIDYAVYRAALASGIETVRHILNG